MEDSVGYLRNEGAVKFNDFKTAEHTEGLRPEKVSSKKQIRTQRQTARLSVSAAM